MSHPLPIDGGGSNAEEEIHGNVLLDPAHQRKLQLEELYREKTEELRLRKEEEACAEAKRLHGLWKSAALEASLHGGQLDLSWKSELTFIDPFLFNFYDTFGLKLRSLRLVGLSLHNLSDDFCMKLGSLEALSLANNKLVTLPGNLFELRNLQILNLLNNQLVSLPGQIGQLTNLLKLEIANNRIESLPPTFGDLNLLVKVNLECNKLKILPENLDRMSSCKYFNVNCNELLHLPRCLARMPNLMVLSACKNVLSYIPSELSNSKSLRSLRLSANRIRLIPDNIGDLRKLKELSLDFNSLLKLPITLHKLVNLNVLRVEGNYSLNDPPPEILRSGAAGVVKYFQDKVKNDEQGRILDIITSTQDCLQQALDKNIVDPSEFEANATTDESADVWFALQMPYFWNVLLPKLQEYWKEQDLKRVVEMKYKTSFYPYSERDVQWAFANYSDAFGPVMKVRSACFRICSCSDKGNRKPCVPPKIGFMCERLCSMIKMKLCAEADRQGRLWDRYKESSVTDAVDRARHEAESYLDSLEGKEWLSAAVFEQSSKVIAADGIEGIKKGWRLRVANRRKKRITRKYDKLLYRTRIERDQHAERMRSELSVLEETLKCPTMIPGGFLTVQTEAKAMNITMQLGNMQEDVRLLRLMLRCENECDIVDDFIFDIDEDESSGSDEDGRLAKLSGDIEPESDDENNAKQDKRDARLRAIEALAVRSRLRAASAAEIEYTAVRARSFVPHDSADKTLVPIQKESAIDVAIGIAKNLAGRAVDTAKRVKKILEEEFAEDVLSSADERNGSGSDSVDAEAHREEAIAAKTEERERILRENRYLRRRFRRVKDVMEARGKRFLRSSAGSAVELVRELSHEYRHQYIKISVADAKEKAERDLYIIDVVRQNMSGIGVKSTFYAWKQWVRDKSDRAKRDRETLLMNARQQISNAVASVQIAEHRISFWNKCVDIYSDEPYWQHTETNAISIVEPCLEQYLPSDFLIPSAPLNLFDTGLDEESGAADKILTPQELVPNGSATLTTRSRTANTVKKNLTRIENTAGDADEDDTKEAERDGDGDGDGEDDSGSDYDEFDYLERVEEDSDGELSTVAYRTASMFKLPSQSVRSLVCLRSNNGISTHSSRALIGRRLSKSGVGSDLINEGQGNGTGNGTRTLIPDLESAQSIGHVIKRASVRSVDHSDTDTSCAVHSDTEYDSLTMHLTRKERRKSFQMSSLHTQGAIDPTFESTVLAHSTELRVFYAPSQLSYALLSTTPEALNMGDQSVRGIAAMPHFSMCSSDAERQHTVNSTYALLPVHAIPRSGMKGRIAKALLKNTPAGDALVQYVRSANIPSGHIIPLCAYGCSVKPVELSVLQKSYVQAKSYLDAQYRADDSYNGIANNSGPISSPSDLERDISFKEKCAAEYFTAAKSIARQRELAETARRCTYLRKPGKSRTLDAIAEARRVLAAEDDKVQEKLRIAAEADLKLNPYKYDMSNFERVKGAVPAEHLLILAADGADTKNIIKSDRKNLDARTALAYKALKVSTALTVLAVRKGIIPSPVKKSWIRKEIDSFFHTTAVLSSSDSEEEAGVKVRRGGHGKGVSRAGRRGKEAKQARADAKQIHDLKMKRKADLIEDKIRRKDEMEEKMYERLNI